MQQWNVHLTGKEVIQICNTYLVVSEFLFNLKKANVHNQKVRWQAWLWRQRGRASNLLEQSKFSPKCSLDSFKCSFERSNVQRFSFKCSSDSFSIKAMSKTMTNMQKNKYIFDSFFIRAMLKTMTIDAKKTNTHYIASLSGQWGWLFLREISGPKLHN